MEKSKALLENRTKIKFFQPRKHTRKLNLSSLGYYVLSVQVQTSTITRNVLWPQHAAPDGRRENLMMEYDEKRKKRVVCTLITKLKSEPRPFVLMEIVMQKIIQEIPAHYCIMHREPQTSIAYILIRLYINYYHYDNFYNLINLISYIKKYKLNLLWHNWNHCMI